MSLLNSLPEPDPQARTDLAKEIRGMPKTNPIPSQALSAKWSLNRYHSAINAGIFEDWKIELLDGDLYEMTPEGPLHSDSIDELQYYLIDLIPRHIAKVRIGHPVTLANGSEPFHAERRF